MLRVLTGLVATWILILGCGVAAAQTSKTIRLTSGAWQPFLSKDASHHSFASFSHDATALGGATRDISSG